MTTTDKVHGPIHPGEILREEFLEPLGISVNRLAREIHVPQSRMAEIVAERRGISAGTALRLSRFFGMSEGFWSTLQADYDRRCALAEIGDDLETITPLPQAG
ncbi:addiction module antidote protein, HigA family [Saccharomonospora sp. CUA-673]|uniref:HigA family addiction module antitoxin n=1 Tax=Saccharomonospora sp. CUA-673 TaxID=1904969 RepID=UPI000964FF8E|nr:HigA family addiction module antitoxin [Saccharomonospora sp. CUA-673]OLT48762.1 addiction module antidote protein, HigA family [Saccharomonospora sp. CUA-673]